MLQLSGGGASYCVGGVACPTDQLVGVAGCCGGSDTWSALVQA